MGSCQASDRCRQPMLLKALMTSSFDYRFLVLNPRYRELGWSFYWGRGTKRRR
jgi:hypothetical protein